MAPGAVRLGKPGFAQRVPPARPRAVRAQCETGKLVVELQDGRVIQVPLAWFDRLMQAPPRALRRCEIEPEGGFISWPDLGEVVSVERLLAPPCEACLDRLWHQQTHGKANPRGKRGRRAA